MDVIGLGAAEYGLRRDFVLQVERRYLQALQRMADDPSAPQERKILRRGYLSVVKSTFIGKLCQSHAVQNFSLVRRV